MKILVINAGSSSLKYQLFDMDTETVLAKGLCERIGIDGHIKHTPKNGKNAFEGDMAFPTHSEAMTAVLKVLVDPESGVISSVDEIDACLLYTSKPPEPECKATSSPRRAPPQSADF